MNNTKQNIRNGFRAIFILSAFNFVTIIAALATGFSTIQDNNTAKDFLLLTCSLIAAGYVVGKTIPERPMYACLFASLFITGMQLLSLITPWAFLLFIAPFIGCSIGKKRVLKTADENDPK
jgi:hypothetical protein